MKPIRFNPDTDLAPIPFEQRPLELALKLKKAGLKWQPHVGCFAWDRERLIQPDSPFPNHVYFILSLPRFLDLFGSLSTIENEMVWIPTWHQARILCRRMGIDDESVYTALRDLTEGAPGEDVCGLYRLMISALENDKR